MGLWPRRKEGGEGSRKSNRKETRMNKGTTYHAPLPVILRVRRHPAKDPARRPLTIQREYGRSPPARPPTITREYLRAQSAGPPADDHEGVRTLPAGPPTGDPDGVSAQPADPSAISKKSARPPMHTLDPSNTKKEGDRRGKDKIATEAKRRRGGY